MIFSQNNYFRSNRLIKVKIKPSPEAVSLANQILTSGSHHIRQKLGEKLLDELCDAAKIDIVKLEIADTKQRHKKIAGRIATKRYGSYRPASKKIEIQNLTAVRGQILAPKTFLDTLLHEWLHHYDTYKLKLRSIHSRGFYERLNDLKRKLLIK
ncbi:MAG: hypothetical protein A3B89_00300 [Candidatus Buchananbacteria bacterium RIFCSPHIGHO2_02_FULL_40_13]|uniref:SprT-like domain-containing protein n=1 Tax=Candidatus Buchananbacteria bacterium RIFCSPLOWO2_01_FULL_39_33 TaxID=1797543 RepID=A0A1G1YH25_9BACT|nr:MAG: hypothetical protein A2820_02940 [Candidatus Buchananbacteria bacterium RIFCSPHIGHO2_01_FULL_40_35]OGY49515.1 MAG: hypothetical protein A3B89_00300 [Candidatus Buchananbacteria bacterium RIFCSPHIGHO2_02_FULL_40_13]OGY51668.1 MAG: hypothetical protein A3A02_00640 [Candidatus Buchananbacteria bacterium RIFCSPLOWO2_01_FULL_39_33]